MTFWPTIKILPLIVVVSHSAGFAADASSLLCFEQLASDQNDRVLYHFTQISGQGLFAAESSSVAGAPVRIEIGTSDLDFKNIEAPVEFENAIVWEGLGTKLTGKVRVRVPNDKNKTYQILLEEATATVVQGYRPVAQLTCKAMVPN